MKYLIIAGLMTAVGAVLASSTSHAESRFCSYNKTSIACRDNPDYEPPPRYNQGTETRPENRRPGTDRPGTDQGYDKGNSGQDPGYDANSREMERGRMPDDRRRYGQDGNGASDYDRRGWEYDRRADDRRWDDRRWDDEAGRPRRWEPPPPPRDWGRRDRDRYCYDVGQELRDYGYRHVRPEDCSGDNFKYTAFRGRFRYYIKVKARTGRIIYEIRN